MARTIVRFAAGTPTPRDWETSSFVAQTLSDHHGSRIPLAYKKASGKYAPYAVCKACGNWVYLSKIQDKCKACNATFSRKTLEEAKAYKGEAPSEPGKQEEDKTTQARKLWAELQALVPELSTAQLPPAVAPVVAAPPGPPADPRKQATKSFYEAFTGLQNANKLQAKLTLEVTECKAKLVTKTAELEESKLKVVEAKRQAEQASEQLAEASRAAVELEASRPPPVAEQPAAQASDQTGAQPAPGPGVNKRKGDGLSDDEDEDKKTDNKEDEMEVDSFKADVSKLLLEPAADVAEAQAMLDTSCENLVRNLNANARRRLRSKGQEAQPSQAQSHVAAGGVPLAALDPPPNGASTLPSAFTPASCDSISVEVAQALLEREQAEQQKQLADASALGGRQHK